MKSKLLALLRLFWKPPPEPLTGGGRGLGWTFGYYSMPMGSFFCQCRYLLIVRGDRHWVIPSHTGGKPWYATSRN